MTNLLELVVRTLDAHQAEDINVMDIHNHNPITTYYVVATANNPRLGNALVDYVEEAIIKSGHTIHHIERSDASNGEWTLLDAHDVIIHIFSPQGRLKYNLDGLWKDVPHVNIHSWIEVPNVQPTTKR